MQRPNMKGPSDATEGAASDERFAKKFPNILEYLQTTAYEDGSARQTSTLSVFLEENHYKLALNDREQKRSAYVSGSTFEGVLMALEGMLAKGIAEWRAWGKHTKKK